MERKKKNIIINKTALILSGVFPGIGQIYKREYMKGFDLIIIQCIFIFFLFHPARMLFSLGVVLVPTIWVWSMVDAGISLTSGRRRHLKYLRLHRWRILLVGTVYIFAVIVFALAATVIKHKLNYSTNTVVIATEEPKLKLLTDRNPITTCDDTSLVSNSANESSIILVKDIQNPPVAKRERKHGETTLQLEKSATTFSEMPSTSTDIQPVNVEAEPEQPSKIDSSRLEGKEAFSYIIITSVFSQYRNAEKLSCQLSQKGYHPMIAPVISSDNQRVHAVVIPVSSTISVAKAITNKLKQEIGECRNCFIATPDSFIATLDKPIVPADRRR